MGDLTSVIDDIIRREGDAYTDHPADRGGPTKYGITLKTLTQYYQREHGRSVTKADLAALTEETARQIYKQLYIEEPGFEQIAERPVRELLIDSGVNHGPMRVIKWLQQIVGVPQDGILGPRTLEAYEAANPREVFAKLLQMRIEWYGKLTKADPSQSQFIHGWLRRATEFLEELV